MINQEKVRLMTRTEWYRQREERHALWVNRYGRGAYVSLQIVKALIICTLGTVVGALIWVFCQSEELLGSNDIDLVLETVRQIAVVYGAVMAVTALVSWRRYSRIYTRSRVSVKRYYNMLRSINRCNEKEKRRLTGKLPSVGKEGERR